MRELARKKLIVALDVSTGRLALDLINALRSRVGMFKIGPQLFTAVGPEIVRQVVKSGERVFLDLKFHDIPNTVAAAGVEATRLGVAMFNLHAAGGREMMQRTIEAVSCTADIEGLSRPAVLAVTVLTSADTLTLRETGTTLNPEEQVHALALLAESCGMDGAVASAREIALIRSAVRTRHFLIVTPGVRPAGAKLNDQKRVMTPAQALQAGADYLVIGRPVTGAKDPERAVEQIIDEMEGVFA